MIEQHTTLEGDVSFLKGLSEEVAELGTQICKWNGRPPDLNDENDEKVPTAMEVQEDLDIQASVNQKNFHCVFNRLHALEGIVSTLERSRDESWEAVSNRVSTLVEGGKVKDQTQDIPKLYALCEQIQRTQQSQEKQLSVLRRFAREVERHLEQLHKGATPPGHTHQPCVEGCGHGAPQTYVPGASASSSAVPSTYIQMPTPPTVSPPPIPKERSPSQRESASLPTHTHQRSRTHFSTVVGQVRAGAIRMDITNPEAGDIAVIRNQEAKKVRDIGSLIFETPIQHDYEEGVEVRSLLSSEQLEEIDDRLAVVDVNPSTGACFVRLWVDEIPLPDESGGDDRKEPDSSRNPHVGTRTPTPTGQMGLETPARRPTGAGCSRESPDF